MKEAGRAAPNVMEHTIIHEPESRRFVVHELGHEAYLTYYELPNHVLDLAHTHTANEIRGRGVATALIRNALDYARENGYRVVAGCPFVQTFVDRHHEYSDLLEERPPRVN